VSQTTHTDMFMVCLISCEKLAIYSSQPVIALVCNQMWSKYELFIVHLSFVCTGPGPTEDLFKHPEGRPVSAKHHRYELATHTVKVRRTGALQEVNAIWDLQGIVDYHLRPGLIFFKLLWENL